MGPSISAAPKPTSYWPEPEHSRTALVPQAPASPCRNVRNPWSGALHSPSPTLWRNTAEVGYGRYQNNHRLLAQLHSFQISY